MKLLFIHDHPFYQENSKVYSGGGLPSKIWQNYLINFESIHVIGRSSLNLKDKREISSNNNVKFHLTENYSSIKDLVLNYQSIKTEIKNLIKNTDIVLVRLPSVLGFIAAEIALKYNKKIWVEQVGNAQEALGAHGSLLGKFAAPIFEVLNKKYVSKADFVTYVTKYKLQNDYPHNYNAVVTNLSNVIIKNILNNTELDISRFNSSFLKIGLIGGFDVKYKGQDILLKAINELPFDIKKNIELYFIGKGDYKWLLDLAKVLGLNENIKFIGALKPGDEINNLLKELSLYVQPSLTEGMPRATIEAMAMGCPVIGSDVGGIPELISKKFIHNKGNYKLLTKHIIDLYNDRNLLLKEANNSILKADDYLLDNLIIRRSNFYDIMNKKINAN